MYERISATAFSSRVTAAQNGDAVRKKLHD
jgi:hypothetical protein